MVVVVEKLAYAGVEEEGGEYFLDECVLEKLALRGAEVEEMDLDGEKYHSALEERQMVYPYVGTQVDFVNDAASLDELVVSEIRVDPHQPHHHRHHHLRLSCP